jgi:hypothetical protein
VPSTPTAEPLAYEVSREALVLFVDLVALSVQIPTVASVAMERLGPPLGEGDPHHENMLALYVRVKLMVRAGAALFVSVGDGVDLSTGRARNEVPTFAQVLYLVTVLLEQKYSAS